MIDPTRVLVVGDWHGNQAWAVSVIEKLPELLPDESPRFIVHTGDFGVWPGHQGAEYRWRLNRELAQVDGKLIFVDGSHEDFSILNERKSNTVWADWPLPLGCENLHWAPRGTRWTWHGREWLAVGGAASVDRALRTQNFNWWPDEEITEAEHMRILTLGHADVMVCHDAPSTVEMRFGTWPRGWDRADQDRSDKHRDRLQAIVDEVRPQWLFHGHYHRHHDLMVKQAYGDLHVVGLDMDGGDTNYVVMDVAEMKLPREDSNL